MRPLAIDLYCGLGGWSSALLAEGYDVVGFDIERHVYGAHRYPAQLVIQDILTLHGSQFRDAGLIVASPPCQAYSYMAMPWKRAKARAAAIRADETGEALADLNRLFDACFRLQAQASLAAGRHIPMVVENVRGAQPWVGRARWNFGSFYLWGDVPALMPFTVGQKFNPDGTNHGPGSIGGGANVPGLGWTGFADTGASWRNRQDVVKAPPGTRWFNDGPRTPDSLASSGSRSPARKAASALIAKIPVPLARHIARSFLPT